MSLITKFRAKKMCMVGLALVMGATMLASGCGKKEEKSASSKDKPFFIGFTNAPGSFNPIMRADSSSRFINKFMYDTLLGQPEVNKFTPHLAQSIETTDNITYTIKLNPKAKWSDGKPVTADDVVYTLNLVANPKVVSGLGRYIIMLAGVDAKGKLPKEGTVPGLVAKDATTVEFKCKTPRDPNYVKGFLGVDIPIVPKHIFEKYDPTKLSSTPDITQPKVFSGPYKFVKYVTNDHVELVANEDYVNGAPKIKKMFLKIENGTNLVVDLKAGKVDMIAGGGIGVVPIKDLAMLKEDKNLVVKSTPPDSSQLLGINNAKFNVKFRRAVTMAVNRQQMVDQLYKGYAKITPTIYTEVSPVYDPSVKPLPYDPEAAKKELAESGYDVSKKIVLYVPIGNILREQSADIIQQNLKTIGLDVELQKLDFPTMNSRAKKGEYDMILVGLSQPIDPDYSNYFTPGAGGNYGNADDPKLNELLAKGAAGTSIAERKPIYMELQKYLRDNQFITVLYSENGIIVQNKKLKGGLKEFWDGTLDGIQNWEMQ